MVFKIKTGDNSELLTPETMRLESKPKLESVEVVLVHCNLAKNDYQHTSKVCLPLFQTNNLNS